MAAHLSDHEWYNQLDEMMTQDVDYNREEIIIIFDQSKSALQKNLFPLCIELSRIECMLHVARSNHFNLLNFIFLQEMK